ncbi:MAG: HDOD domain-containing protein, partial [Nitrospinaceae bacterium]|nr:HDOD domain-containing protein [Nitrospinaceae bacterium]NIR55660.1 HDOD domain-containing protein [Nitrospinaceae bacterium]NIS86104.1 HDOD domain-containing protein [Nitrospinaceae bacterium]NIT82948.1 HDOD domain-containing protein [Nitrospinaceae bacterium]NIU45151.1 HDOD domain-containing protein [Nitrospinaceae bacterium]
MITRIDAFPVLPRMYRQLTAELQSPETSIDQVAEIISRDVGMTAKIFQIANSAFFGFTNRIQSPHHAVQVLGLDMIRSLVLTYQIFKKFDPDKVESLQVDRLWTHSLNVTGRA